MPWHPEGFDPNDSEEFIQEANQMVEFLKSRKTAKEYFPGPWQDEEDDKMFWVEGESWVQAKTHKNNRIDKKWLKRYGFKKAPVKLHCVIHRMDHSGSLNGYVGVPMQHVSTYGFVFKPNEGYLDVHGGVSFSGRSDVASAPLIPELYYFGFDTGRGYDIIPSQSYRKPLPGSQYRNMEYVEAEVRRMATQLMEFEPDSITHSRPTASEDILLRIMRESLDEVIKQLEREEL
ncbi:hypothetical protein [Paenibacillus xylanexedens]|uniref:hypothetical protein n=1 Tax=Paenibacillus xylanexedens TaxID=528191 RepID=UPI0011AA1A03|nr:hypothetical protein [Paenibacillus xylanexedens]